MIAAALGIAFFVAVVIAEKIVVRRAPVHVAESRPMSVVAISDLTKTFPKGQVTALQGSTCRSSRASSCR